MKKILLNSVILIVFVSCNTNNSEKKTGSDSTKTYQEVGVPNVNGNIPDTTNAIDLTHKLDTISNKKKDSAK